MLNSTEKPQDQQQDKQTCHPDTLWWDVVLSLFAFKLTIGDGNRTLIAHFPLNSIFSCKLEIHSDEINLLNSRKRKPVLCSCRPLYTVKTQPGLLMSLHNFHHCYFARNYCFCSHGNSEEVEMWENSIRSPKRNAIFMNTMLLFFASILFCKREQCRSQYFKSAGNYSKNINRI